MSCFVLLEFSMHLSITLILPLHVIFIVRVVFIFLLPDLFLFDQFNNKPAMDTESQSRVNHGKSIQYLLSISKQTNQAVYWPSSSSREGRWGFWVPFKSTNRSKESCQAATRLAKESWLIVWDYPAKKGQTEKEWEGDGSREVKISTFYAKLKQGQNTTLLEVWPKCMNRQGCMYVQHIAAA